MRQRREIHSGVASSMAQVKKEDRRREAIGFEIPVTRGAFDHREGSTNDIKYHKSTNSTAVKHGSRSSNICRKVGERKQLN